MVVYGGQFVVQQVGIVGEDDFVEFVYVVFVVQDGVDDVEFFFELGWYVWIDYVVVVCYDYIGDSQLQWCVGESVQYYGYWVVVFVGQFFYDFVVFVEEDYVFEEVVIQYW